MSNDNVKKWQICNVHPSFIIDAKFFSVIIGEWINATFHSQPFFCLFKSLPPNNILNDWIWPIKVNILFPVFLDEHDTKISLSTAAKPSKQNSIQKQENEARKS